MLHPGYAWDRMKKRPVPLRSDLGCSTPDRIGVLGYDLVRDLVGKVSLGDMGFLEIMGRLPNAHESTMFEAMLVTLVEHGIVPSTLAARLTYAGAPEALQAAVAAGLLGLGSVFVGSTEGAARMLSSSLASSKGARPAALAVAIVDAHRQEKRILPGLGHPVHVPTDPRTTRLFTLARRTGFYGQHCALMVLVSRRASKVTGRSLPVNATGAIGAIACDMGLPLEACRAIGVMARAVGLVGHVLEEMRRPMAREVWVRTEEEASRAARGKLRHR